MKNHVLLYFAVAALASTLIFCKNGNTNTTNTENSATGLSTGNMRNGTSADTSKPTLPPTITDSLFGFKGCERAGFRSVPPNIREFKYQNFSVQITPNESGGEHIQVTIDSLGRRLLVPDVEPTVFSGAVRNHILVDVSTGPDQHELIIYDLKRGTLAQTYRTQYCGELYIASSGTVWFYYPVEEKDVTKMPDCPEKEDWVKKGLHVGYGQRYMFNLPTRGLTKKSEFTCIPVK